MKKTSDIGKSVAKNTVIMLGTQGITWISSFILLLFLPRYLGSESYGRLYLAVSMAMILSISIDFGGNYLIPKEVSRNPGNTPRLLTSYIGVRTVLWIVSMGILMGFTYLAGYSSTVKLLVLILGISKLWEGISKVIRSCFQGYEMMEYPSLGMIIQKVFISGVSVGALLLGYGALTIAIIMAVGVLLKMITAFYFTPRIVQQKPKLDWSYSLDLIKNSLPYFLWTLFSVIYYRVDAVMLSLITNDSIVGWYGGAYRFFDVVMFLPNIYTTVIFPILSKLWDKDDLRMHNTLNKSIKYLLLAGIPVGILIFAFSKNIISLFYGLDEYGPSVNILQIFSISVVLVYVDFILGNTILASDKQKQWAWTGFAAVILNIVLNYLMIPYAQNVFQNGGIGAAIATFITEFTVMGAALWILPKNLFSNFEVTAPFKGVIAGIIMFLGLWYLQHMEVYWVIRALLGLMIYSGMLYVLRIFNPQEWRYFRELFSYQTIKNEFI